MSKERDAIEARALLSNEYFQNTLDNLEKMAIGAVTAASEGDIKALRIAAIRLSEIKKLRQHITITSRKDNSNVNDADAGN
jgi:hypothetical protein